MMLPFEKIALGIGVVLFLLFALLGLTGGKSADEIAGTTPPSINRYQETMLPEPDLQQVTFENFPAQRGETGWNFALFTPPNVWYNEETVELIPFPPRLIIEEEPEPEEEEPEVEMIPFGLVYTGFEEIPFPIKLLGYVGEEGEFYVNLRNLENRENFLSAPGRTHPEHGIDVEDFRLLRRDEDGVRYTLGEVTLRSRSSGREIVLIQGEERGTGAYHAVFVREANPDDLVRLEEGETFNEGDVVFTLQSLDREANEVTVERDEPGRPDPLTFTLMPGEQKQIESIDAPAPEPEDSEEQEPEDSEEPDQE